MKFLIQDNLMDAEQLALTKAAVQPFPYEFIGLTPFSREITFHNPLEGQDYIPYGSTLLTTLALDYGWKGLHYDLSTFNYRTAIWNREDMLNHYIIEPIEKIIPFLRNCDPKKQWFIRPSLDLKQFSGQILEAKVAADWLEDALGCVSGGSYKIDTGTDIVISPPQQLSAEWRWFIVDNQIVDGSMYRVNERLTKKHEDDKTVIKKAQALADGWLPDSCCVMDTALVDNCHLRVIEFNCINSSGFYDHAVDKIFSALYKHHS